MSEFDNRKLAQASQDALPYPLDAFPSLVRDTISEIHADTNIGVELLGAVALGAMSLVCQGSTDVRVQPNDEPIPCNLYLLTIAEPHSGKSHATKVFNESARRFEEQRSEDVKKANDALPGKLAAWKIAEKKLSKALALAKEGTPEFEECEGSLIEHHATMPVKRRHEQLIFTVATPAGIREMLAANNGSIGIVAPDAGNVVNGPAFSNLPSLSGLWSGEDVRDGLASGSPPIIEPRLTLSLMLQDIEFQKFMKKRGSDALENGLLSRFLVMRSPLRDTKENNLPKEKLALFRDRMTWLLSRPVQCSSKREVLKFSEQAITYWNDYRDKLSRQIKQNDWSGGKRYFVSRLHEQMARIAALFHHVDQDDAGVISLDSAYGASKLCDWYLFKFDDALAGKDRRDAQALAKWIKNDYRKTRTESLTRFLSTTYTTQELLQYGPVRKSDALAAAMKILINEGDVTEGKLGPKGGGNYDFNALIKRGLSASEDERPSYPSSGARVTSLGWEERESNANDS